MKMYWCQQTHKPVRTEGPTCPACGERTEVDHVPLEAVKVRQYDEYLKGRGDGDSISKKGRLTKRPSSLIKH